MDRSPTKKGSGEGRVTHAIVDKDLALLLALGLLHSDGGDGIQLWDVQFLLGVHALLPLLHERREDRPSLDLGGGIGSLGLLGLEDAI